MPGSQLTADFIEDRLKLKGNLFKSGYYVLLIFNISTGVAHTNVVYGVGFPTGTERLISTMDPSETDRVEPTGLYRNRPVSFYQGRDFVFVGWRRP